MAVDTPGWLNVKPGFDAEGGIVHGLYEKQ